MGRVRIVADRIAQFVRRDLKLARIGAKLRRDRIGGIGRIDECVHRGRNRDGVAAGDFRQGAGRLDRGVLPRMRDGSRALQLFAIRAQARLQTPLRIAPCRPP